MFERDLLSKLHNHALNFAINRPHAAMMPTIQKKTLNNNTYRTTFESCIISIHPEQVTVQ